MIKIIKKTIIKGIITSLLLCLIAVIIMSYPIESLTLVFALLGLLISIDGVLDIISYFTTEKKFKIFNFGLFEGTVEIITGALAMCYTNVVIAIFPVAIGLWIIIKSLMRMQFSINFSKYLGNRIIGETVLVFFSIILGILLIANPSLSMEAIFTVSAAYILILEIINIIISIIALIKLRKVEQHQ